MATIDENVKIMLLKGERGASISSIQKTSSDGLIDTYTVTMENGYTQKFYVTNGEKGDKGDKGDTGAMVPTSGMFSLAVDNDGNLWMYYTDPDVKPKFEYDSATGNLYYVAEG